MGSKLSHSPREESPSSTDSALATIRVEGEIPGSDRRQQIELKRDDKIKALTKLLTTQNKRRRNIYRDDFDHHQENTQILKHMFKKMDPAVTKGATYVSHGDVELSFKYDKADELLLVKVMRARGLEAKDLRGKSANAYVKLYLHPSDEHGTHEKTTQIVSDTLNPAFHEIFSFPVAPARLQVARLVAQVWDHDPLDKDDVIGETIVGLAGLGLRLRPVHTAWYQLCSETDLRITGDLDVTLSYKKPQTLLVTVHRANNLTNRYEEGAPNPFVKLQLPGIQSVFETKVQHDTVNPVWEKTFEFTIRPEEFNSRYLILHAIDFDDANKNESLGQVIIELNNFEPEAGYHGNFDLADLKNTERLKSKWFQHAAVQEFREALVAHACAATPSFLFQKHHGSKVIRLMSCKARAETRLRMIDGVPVY